MTRRKRYSAELKREALRRANEEGVTDVLVARRTGHQRATAATLAQRAQEE
jgi:transposase-like protein